VEVDAEGGVDVFGDHTARAEDVGPLVLGPPRQAWRDDVGAATTQSARDRFASDGANDDTDLDSSLFVPAGPEQTPARLPTRGRSVPVPAFRVGKGRRLGG
jgi:hypothetical protein